MTPEQQEALLKDYNAFILRHQTWKNGVDERLQALEAMIAHITKLGKEHTDWLILVDKAIKSFREQSKPIEKKSIWRLFK